MSETIRIQPESMEAGIIKINEVSEMLEELEVAVEGIAARLENGALLGRGGETLSNGLRTKLNASIRELREKYIELGQDVQTALTTWIETDGNQQFGGTL